MSEPLHTSDDLPLTFRNIRPYSASGQPPEGAPDWIWEVDHPYLHGLYAPVDSEVDADELVVEAGDTVHVLEWRHASGVNVPTSWFFVLSTGHGTEHGTPSVIRTRKTSAEHQPTKQQLADTADAFVGFFYYRRRVSRPFFDS